MTMIIIMTMIIMIMMGTVIVLSRSFRIALFDIIIPKMPFKMFNQVNPPQDMSFHLNNVSVHAVIFIDAFTLALCAVEP